MSYTTTFTGAFAIEPPLGPEGKAALARARETPPIAVRASCHWIASEDGGTLAWDGADSARDERAWLEVVTTALAAAGHHVSGEVAWEGEDPTDRGVLVVRDGRVTIARPGQEANLTARLRDHDPELRRAARDELAQLLWDGATPELIALYIEQLTAAEVETKIEIIDTLASMLAIARPGVHEAQVSSVFYAAADDRDERMRARAAAALAHVTDADRVLERLLVDASPLVQGQANHALHRRRTRPR